MNLSSSEEEDDNEKEEELTHHPRCKTYTDADTKEGRQEEESDDESGFSDVEWEDAIEVDDDVKMSSETTTIDSFRNFPKEDVVVHFDPFSEKEESSHLIQTKHRKRKRINKIKHVSTHVDRILLNLQRTHVLSLVARTVCLSSTIGNVNEEELWGIAYSLIPMEFHNHSDCTILDESTTIPNIDLLHKFCSWFFEFVNVKASSKRQRSNSNKSEPYEDKLPSSDVAFSRKNIRVHLIMVLQYLSSSQTDSKPLLIRPVDKVLIFICMTR